MKIGLKVIKLDRQIYIFLFLVLILFVIFLIFLPPAVDWSDYYRPATIALINQQSPYSINGFINPPWVLIPMIPLLIFPENVGRAILAVAMMSSLFFVSKKMGAGLIGSIALLLSPPAIQLIMDGNVDWMVTLGFILPPQIGLFFIAIKPQMGIMVIPFWMLLSWKKGGYKELLRVFGPFTIVVLLMLIIFGLSPIMNQQDIAWGGNASLWPISIPVGMVLFIHSIRNKDINFSIAASPCLSPFVLLHSWIGVFLVLSRQKWETLVAVVGLWIVVIIHWFY